MRLKRLENWCRFAGVYDYGVLAIMNRPDIVIGKGGTR